MRRCKSPCRRRGLLFSACTSADPTAIVGIHVGHSRERRSMKGKLRGVRAFLLLLLFTFPLFAFAQSKPADAEGHQWWQHAVFYEIYPRSFADSNNDGIGDLNGIDFEDRLSEVTWAWTRSGSRRAIRRRRSISATTFPITKISIRCTERWRTSTAWRRWRRRHDVRIIMDFVLNHTSDKHKWFLDSSIVAHVGASRLVHLAGRQGPGPAAEQLDLDLRRVGVAVRPEDRTSITTTIFYPQQPDLNWRNPAVEKAMFDATRLWYKRGVAGFRLDAVDTLFEDPEPARQSRSCPARTNYGDPNMENKYNDETSRRSMTNCASCARSRTSTNAVLIGETWTIKYRELESITARRKTNCRCRWTSCLHGE